MSGVPPNARQAWAQLQKMATQAGKGGPGGGPGPRGVGAGLGGLLLLGGLAVTANNALFNVDGGHRAIKYTRIGGVKQEIYNEGL
jgi:prohibitin 2